MCIMYVIALPGTNLRCGRSTVLMIVVVNITSIAKASLSHRIDLNCYASTVRSKSTVSKYASKLNVNLI